MSEKTVHIFRESTPKAYRYNNAAYVFQLSVPHVAHVS